MAALLSYVARILTLVGLLSGCYRSFKLLKENEWNKKRSNLLLRLWVVLSYQAIYEQWIEVFIDWIPLYYEGKCALLLWLLWPESKGPKFIFDKFVRPTMTLLHSQMRRHVSPKAMTILSQILRRTQNIVLVLTRGGMYTDEMTKWESQLLTQAQVCQAEMQRRVRAATQM